jgi:hypothetical protein
VNLTNLPGARSTESGFPVLRTGSPIVTPANIIAVKENGISATPERVYRGKHSS